MLQLLSPGNTTRESVSCNEGSCMTQQRPRMPQLRQMQPKTLISKCFLKDYIVFFFKNEFSAEIFQLTLPRSNRGIYAAITYNVLPKYNELNIIIIPRSMCFGMNFVLAAVKITRISLYFSITFLDALSISSNI